MKGSRSPCNIYILHILYPTVIIIGFDLVNLFFNVSSERLIQAEQRTQHRANHYVPDIHESNSCCQLSFFSKEEGIRFRISFRFSRHAFIAKPILWATFLYDLIVRHEFFDYTKQFTTLYICICRLQSQITYQSPIFSVVFEEGRILISEIHLI